MGCCSSRAPGTHEWQAQVPGSYKENPVPKVNRKQEVPADFFQKCFMKGYLRTLPKKQRIWCMIHENNVLAPPPDAFPCTYPPALWTERKKLDSVQRVDAVLA